MSYDFRELYSTVQAYMTRNFPTQLAAEMDYKKGREEVINRVKPFLQRTCPTALTEGGPDLLDRLYEYLSGFAFLAPYIRRPDKHLDVEEININRWDSIVRKESNGSDVFMEDRFLSPQHAIDVFSRVFAAKDVVWTESVPHAETDLGNNVRIAMDRYPRIPPELGVMGSIRLVHEGNGIHYDFVPESLNEDMHEFLHTLALYRQSLLIGGERGAGKSSFLNFILQGVKNDGRLLTIEENAREIGGLETRDETGRLTNQILPYLVRSGDNVSDVIYAAQRMNYDRLVPQELRSDETYAALEAAYTGAVYTTVHIKAANMAWSRVADLTHKKIPYDRESLMDYVIHGLPVAAFMSKSPDQPKPIRRVMEIIEGEGYDNRNGLKYRTLYRFRSEGVTQDECGNRKVKGGFERVKGISPNLQHLLQNSYCPVELIHEFADKEEWDV